MSLVWKVALLIAIILLFAAATVYTAQETKPAFTAKDHQLIEAYYNHLIGTLAPGSIDRSTFPLGIEKTLVVGSHVPMQLEKELELLPAKLESQLSQITGDYGRYKLGRHVVLVKKTDLTIADILNDVAYREPAK